MGSKAKYDKLAGLLGWNAKSELRRTCRREPEGKREGPEDAKKKREILENAMDNAMENGENAAISPNISSN